MIDIIQAINDPHLFKPLFKDLKTWASWLVFLKALFALPMTAQELTLYKTCTGREKPPERPFTEAWVPDRAAVWKELCGGIGGGLLGLFS